MRARPTLLLLLPVLTAGMCTVTPLEEVEPLRLPGASFEEGTIAEGSGLPTFEAEWTGAVVEIVGDENGVSPSDGGQMLAFRATAPDPDDPERYLSTSVARKLIALESWHGGNEFILEASFASSVPAAGLYNATLEILYIDELDHNNVDNPYSGNVVGGESITWNVYGDWTVWSLSSTMPLEAAAAVVTLSVEAQDAASDSSVQQTFDGIYADDLVFRIRERRPI